MLAVHHPQASDRPKAVTDTVFVQVRMRQVDEGRWEEQGEASGEAGDEEFMMMALFNDDAAAQPVSQEGLLPPAKPVASTLAPWGTENHRRKKKGLKGEPFGA